MRWTAACLAVVAAGAVAQVHMSEGDAKPSPLRPALERLDDELRQRIASADDAGSRWISGELETLDIAARVRDFGAAAARNPRETLFPASLAIACVPRTVPSLPECEVRDSVASFAVRDPDNAVPWLLLAERARQRRLLSSVGENLERASTSHRFDDYTQHAAEIYAAKIRVLPGGSDRGTDAVAAAAFLDRAAGSLAPAMTALCGPRREVGGEGVARACQRIAALMVEHAPNLADRALGASLAAANAPSDSARAAADAMAREIAARRQRCADTFETLARIAASPGDAAGARAQTAAYAWAADRARGDEYAACERLASAIGVKPR